MSLCICGHPEAVHAPAIPRRCVGCGECGALPQDDPPGPAHGFIPCDCPGFEPDTKEAAA